jgi:tight adherence protein B
MSVVPVVATAVLVATIATAVLDPSRIRRVRHGIDAEPDTARRRRRQRAVSFRRRRSTVGAAVVGAWADEIARSLRHGSTLRAALATVVPDDEVLLEHTSPLRHRLDRGASVVDAADGWAGDINRLEVGGAELLAAFAAVVGASAQLGGSTSTPLERFAVTMRQRVSDDLERGAQSAQAKMSARVLTIVPLAVLALLLATDADVRRVLAEPRGALVLTVGLTLNAVGGWWMRRIVETPVTGVR